MTCRIGEHGDHLVHFEESAGPAMGYHQWHGIWPLSLLMDEVDTQAVDVRLEMAKRVDQFLLGAPIELGTPVLNQLFDVVEIAAVVPSRAGNLIRPPGAG